MDKDVLSMILFFTDKGDVKVLIISEQFTEASEMFVASPMKTSEDIKLKDHQKQLKKDPGAKGRLETQS